MRYACIQFLMVFALIACAGCNDENTVGYSTRGSGSEGSAEIKGGRFTSSDVCAITIVNENDESVTNVVVTFQHASIVGAAPSTIPAHAAVTFNTDPDDGWTGVFGLNLAFTLRGVNYSYSDHGQGGLGSTRTIFILTSGQLWESNYWSWY